MKKKRFYQIATAERVADINIYGDITSWEWFDSDVSAHSLKTEIDELDVDTINVYINSYGGEVAEALAICSSLQRHKAEIHTFCDGFACSAASVIFCAGTVRTMGKGTLLMIHNCMSYLGLANSTEMRKAAKDNEKINQASIEYYKQASNLSEEEIQALMDDESWLTAQECIEKGFATEIAGEEEEEEEETMQSAFQSISERILGATAVHENTNMEPIMERLAKLQESVDGLTAQGGDPKHLDGQKQTGTKPKEPEKPKPEENFLANMFKNLI